MLQLAHECGKVLSGHWLWRWNIIKPLHDWAPKEIKHLFRDGCVHTVTDSSSHSACFNPHCSVCWTKCTIPGHKSMQKLPKKEAYELWAGMLTRRGDKTGSTLPLWCWLYHIQGLLSVNAPHLPRQQWGNCAVSVSGYNTYESGIQFHSMVITTGWCPAALIGGWRKWETQKKHRGLWATALITWTVIGIHPSQIWIQD